MSCTYCGSEENLIVGPMTDICEKCAAAEAAHNAHVVENQCAVCGQLNTDGAIACLACFDEAVALGYIDKKEQS